MLEFLKKMLCNSAPDKEMSASCASCSNVNNCHIVEAALDHHDVDVYSFSCSLITVREKLKIDRRDLVD